MKRRCCPVNGVNAHLTLSPPHLVMTSSQNRVTAKWQSQNLADTIPAPLTDSGIVKQEAGAFRFAESTAGWHGGTHDRCRLF